MNDPKRQDRSRSMKNINNSNPTLDGIRGWAFLIVLVMHGFSLCLDGAQQYLQGCGKYGVWLFFVLSSYLLTKNYVLADGSKLEYITGRIFRILPLYFICIILYSFFNLFSPTAHDYMLASFGLFGPGHLWTIPVEFYFYFALLIIWFVPKPLIRNLLMTLTALGGILFLRCLPKDPNSTNVLWYMPSFFCGYILAVIIPRLTSVKVGFVVPASILTGFIFLSPGAQLFLLKKDPSPYLLNMYFPLSILWGIFIFSILNTKSKIIGRIFMSRALTFLGKVSYSGYLFHWIAMVQLKRVMGSSIATVLVGIVFSIVIAFIVNKVIEMPIYRIRKVLLTEVAPEV